MKDIYLESLQKELFILSENSDTQNTEYLNDAEKAIGTLGVALSKIKHIDSKTRKQFATRINDALKYLNSKPEPKN